jgi:hypothetical protein
MEIMLETVLQSPCLAESNPLDRSAVRYMLTFYQIQIHPFLRAPRGVAVFPLAIPHVSCVPLHLERSYRARTRAVLSDERER